MSSMNQSVETGNPPSPGCVVPQEGVIAVGAPQARVPGPEGTTRIGVVPAALVLLAAFFLASTPAHNSDFWLHLATGKALIHGQYQFGAEPFSGDSTEYWTNPSWLYDVLVYLLYLGLGGAALVILKALVVALTAGLLMVSGSTRRSFSLSSVCTGLAMVVMGPWLALKPLFLSFFFLAWTIWYLERMLADESASRGLLSFWPLLLVFVLWSNLDRWFFLGPLSVALYFLGSLLPAQGGKANARILGVLTLAGVAVCLLNPHHVHIFSVPFQIEFSGVAAQLEADPYLRLITSPFQNIYFFTGWPTLPGLAFWILALGTLLSFVMAYGRWPWRWGLLWACLFLLSYFHIQAVPFFALVSGPILARNLGHFWARQGMLADRLLDLGRALAFVATAAMALAAWPGWLSIGPRGPRAWRVETESGMTTIAEQLGRWWAQGKTPGTALPFSPETGNYLAWACPEIPCRINSHLHFSQQAAVDLLAVRDGLMGVISPGASAADWRAVLRTNKVGLLVIQGADQPGLAAIRNLSPAFQECPLLALKGKTAVFGWTDPFAAPGTQNIYTGIVLDLQKEAFSSTSPDVAITAPDRNPRPMRWWDAFWRARYSPSADRDAAQTLLAVFDGVLVQQRQKINVLGQSKLLAELACSVMLPGPANAGCCFQADLFLDPPLSAFVLQTFAQELDEGPLAVLYLAVRACRRALQANPDDVQTYFLLGETYGRLRDFTHERSWGPVFGNFRTCQITAAYKQAQTLEPDNWRIHQNLAAIFLSMADYKDLALDHSKQVYRIRRRGPEPGESKDQFETRMGLLKNNVQILEKEVQDLADRLAVNSQNLRVVDRANLAGEFGLSGKALEILLRSDIAAFGTKGMEIELKLLLNTGRVEEVKSWLNPEHEALLGNINYNLIKAQMEAARGSYSEAIDALKAMLLKAGTDPKSFRSSDPIVLDIGRGILFETSGGPFRMFPMPDFNMTPDLHKQVLLGLSFMDREASSLVLQGALALEGADNRHARQCFERAMAFWNSPAGAFFTEPRSLAGRRLAQYFLRQFASAKP